MSICFIFNSNYLLFLKELDLLGGKVHVHENAPVLNLNSLPYSISIVIGSPETFSFQFGYPEIVKTLADGQFTRGGY